MKKQGIFPGILLIGIGLYFLLEELQFSAFKPFYTWPTLLIIIGIAFLARSQSGGDGDSIFPGIILVGLGIHFHAAGRILMWPDHWAVYTIILGVAFMAKWKKTGSGIAAGLILLGLSAFALFYDGLMTWLGFIDRTISWMERFWPVALIALGLYFLFFKKK
ncbi:LiaI-LiaF-like domain-containing protein [Bacillus marinisedimentorum]|uniref:LiaI-LiaF-like domain-containing protein n=1 Tax=Bacillus marinisedimentorum TaxID=1821260 RepID=UPI0008733A65|nr:DUF5668 domain-containing protein [Bacillus marinisedimentorum]